MILPPPPASTSLRGSGAVLLCALAGACFSADGPSPAERPSAGAPGAVVDGPALVVVVVVDQLRADLLTRYDDLFSHGFRRLLDGGAVFVNATHDHARTETAVGHTTLATGRYPRSHGIVGNNWTEVDAWGTPRRVYAVEDGDSPVLGFPSAAGRSPANIRAPGLADWVLAQNPDARIVSVSRKDRSAIALATTAPGQVYWIMEAAGVFTTSRFYRRTLPDWVDGYNEMRMRTIYADSVWTSIVPDEARSRSLPDTADYEWDGVHTFFPHRAHVEVDAASEATYNGWFTRTPGGDAAVAELALTALEASGAGTGATPDYLAVSFSAVDYVGHRFGPLSREQLDNLLRLDRVLGEFMDALDRSVGPDRWVLGFSADHGVMDVPESDPALRRAVTTTGREVRARVMDLASDTDEPAVASPEFMAWLEDMDHIGGLTSYEALRGAEPTDSIRRWQRNGFFEGRHKDVLGLVGLESFRPEGVLVNSDAAASHGSPYHYDRWVPLIFYGPGVEAGVHEERAATVDLAPTMAALAGLRTPPDLDGRDLLRR